MRFKAFLSHKDFKWLPPSLFLSIIKRFTIFPNVLDNYICERDILTLRALCGFNLWVLHCLLVLFIGHLNIHIQCFFLKRLSLFTWHNPAHYGSLQSQLSQYVHYVSFFFIQLSGPGKQLVYFRFPAPSTLRFELLPSRLVKSPNQVVFRTVVVQKWYQKVGYVD